MMAAERTAESLPAPTRATSDSGRPELLAEIYRVLDEIYDPCSVASSVPMGLVEMGLVKSVHASEAGEVRITLRLTSPFCEMVPFMNNESIRKVEALDGVTACAVEHDSGMDWDHSMIAPAANERRALRLRRMQQALDAR